MKRVWLAGLLMVSAAGFQVVGAGDVWQELKIAKVEASKGVVSSFAYGNVDTYRVASIFRKASPETRAALVEQVLIWTKAYTESPQFAKDYASTRESAKPVQEEQPSVDEELKQRREQRKVDLEASRKSIAEMPAEYRKAAEEGYKAAVESLKALDTPEFRKMEREALVQERRMQEESYAQSLEEWEENYPADPKALIRKRLEEFLEATDEVDFTAKTAAKSGRQRFVDAEYESKPSEWKLAYRAGRPATEKARAFAQQWLSELE